MVINISHASGLSKHWPAMVRRLLKLEFPQKAGVGFMTPFNRQGEQELVLIDTKENIIAFLDLVEEEIRLNMRKLSAQFALLTDISELRYRARNQ